MSAAGANYTATKCGMRLSQGDRSGSIPVRTPKLGAYWQECLRKHGISIAFSETCKWHHRMDPRAPCFEPLHHNPVARPKECIGSRSDQEWAKCQGHAAHTRSSKSNELVGLLRRGFTCRGQGILDCAKVPKSPSRGQNCKLSMRQGEEIFNR